MQPLSPPEYPPRPDAPLFAMGQAFSEDLSRTLVSAIWHENAEQPHETDVRTAAGLTMLEAFHPRDQLECMLATQGVAAHCAVMDSFRSAANPNMPPLLAIKFRASAVSINRMFCTNLHQLEHVQSRPLPPGPGQPPAAPTPPGDPPPTKPRARAKTAKPANPIVAPPSPVAAPPAEPLPRLEDIPELPEDIETRPDGTPGNLTAYAPKVPTAPYVPPREAPIMMALATRPKPWRMVNIPKEQAPIGTASADPDPPAAALAEPEPQTLQSQTPRETLRGPVDLRERIFTGDALARFAATRFDPDAPEECLQFDSDAAEVELELLSTGGDPEAEADKAAMQAAHPDGKPIVTFRYGTRPVPSDPPLRNETDDPPPDG